MIYDCVADESSARIIFESLKLETYSLEVQEYRSYRSVDDGAACIYSLRRLFVYSLKRLFVEALKR